MTDLSKRLREDLVMPQCMVDQVDTITAAALSGGLGQAVRVAEQALDALDQPIWLPIAEVPRDMSRIIGAVNGHVMGDLYRGDHPW